MTREELGELICELLEIEEVNSMIENQISKFQKQHGYSFKDIGRAIFYYVDILNNKPKREMGIGIVPFVMDDAQKYFRIQAIENERLKREGLKINTQADRRTILVKPTQKTVNLYRVDMEDL